MTHSSDSVDHTYLLPQDALSENYFIELGRAIVDGTVIISQKTIDAAASVDPPAALQEQIAVLQESVAWLEKENERQNDELTHLRAKAGTIGRRLANVLRHLGMEK